MRATPATKVTHMEIRMRARTEPFDTAPGKEGTNEKTEMEMEEKTTTGTKRTHGGDAGPGGVKDGGQRA